MKWISRAFYETLYITVIYIYMYNVMYDLRNFSDPLSDNRM